MWPLPPIQDNYLCIDLSANQLSCAWISISKKNQLSLKAYTKIAVPYSAHIAHQQYINSFVAQHRLEYAFTLISLDGPCITQHLLPLASPHAVTAQLSAPEIEKLLWDIHFLHMLDTYDSMFYWWGIEHALYARLVMMVEQTGTHLLAIDSRYHAHVQSYKKIYGSAFRQSQLSIDLQKNNYALDQILSMDSICRLLHIEKQVKINTVEEKKSLLAAIGLICQEQMI